MRSRGGGDIGGKPARIDARNLMKTTSIDEDGEWPSRWGPGT